MDDSIKNRERAFGRIYDENINPIYRFVLLRVNSKEAAEDLVSETFLKGWEAFRQAGAAIENPRAFLYKIAKNMVVDHYREKGRTTVVSAEGRADELADPRVDVAQSAAVNADMEAVRKAIAGLNDDYQNAIIWRYLDEMPIKEIAGLLDRSEEATRVLIHRAMKELRMRLA